MIRKTIITVLTLAAVSTTALRISLIDAASFSRFSDRHWMGFAMIRASSDVSLRAICYRSYPGVAIPIRWQSLPRYNVLIMPLWSLLVVLWCNPIMALIRRARRRRYVERRWFAVRAGMSAFAVAAIVVICSIDSAVYRRLYRLTAGSDTAAMAVVLGLLVMVPAVSEIVTHNMIAGPLRRASQRKPRTCVACSYNLTGNVSGICPECGTPVAKERRIDDR